MQFGVIDGAISGTLFSLRLAAELLVAHPSVRSLIQSAEPGKKIKDCFNTLQKSPLKSNALSSYLWELQALAQHAHPAVAAVVKIFSSPLDSPSVASELEVTEKVTRLHISDFLKKDLKELRKLKKIE